MSKNNRKNEHVSLSEKFYAEKAPAFNDITFVHHSFPEMDVKDVDLSVSLGDLTFTSPFFINAMTGGSDWTKRVNEKLAYLAREADLAMATGSVSAALKDPSQQDSFKIVRQTNPNGLVFANLGAGHGLENAKKVVDLLEADAIQIHINAPQEVVMPEGDREFRGWLKNIESIVEGLRVPVIAKEVGFGMSRETIRQLESVGVQYIDVSGKGGTNFAQIENYRRADFKLDDLESWGQSTVISLLEAAEVSSSAHIIASGGIRRPIDMVKAMALGASLNGLSSQFMHMALDDVDQAVETIKQWKTELAHTMTLLGAHTIADLQRTDLVLTGETAAWCAARQIDIQRYAFRS
ncbi:Isopentenyl-diphosphate delta-isomerase, FMN-dependent [Alkalibacterium sp. AK22]|uniref:type 2 isopentenyl-diphosphate Delta-isomerase n=1 Tax=Alkalibacterium sp. AK22 TaxID=1229520 RepID=UPI00045048A2|nr:type 2 isopentenyl-diphosphate Delta-isomerase [Alkalibacterium sp. AK22]EXJ23651.1 Isopentenyl-diphosphate delta-isomerase, FMN-dependent [Alkalibacterium sp. AK22]